MNNFSCEICCNGFIAHKRPELDRGEGGGEGGKMPKATAKSDREGRGGGAKVPKTNNEHPLFCFDYN